jgi:ABC-type transport system involved in cytochrome bd biosynthesis fused ATPase/permease subunit
MPAGISQKRFEEKRQELEQYLNSKIEFCFNKNLVMKLTAMNLSNKYKYKFEECNSPLAIYCGETHSGKFILDLEKCPHIIVAGETNSGKSSLLDVITLSLILNKYNVELKGSVFRNSIKKWTERCKDTFMQQGTPWNPDIEMGVKTIVADSVQKNGIRCIKKNCLPCLEALKRCAEQYL